MRRKKAASPIMVGIELAVTTREAFDGVLAVDFMKLGRVLVRFLLTLLLEAPELLFSKTFAKVGVLIVSLLVVLRFCAHAQLSPYPVPPQSQVAAPPQVLPPPPGYSMPPVSEIPPAYQPAPPRYVVPAPLPPGPQYVPPSGPPVQARPPQSWDANPQFGGRVRRYILTPVGEVEGLEMDDGTDVRFPPHVGDRVVAIVRPGDSIAVSGEPGPATPYGRVIRASTITNVASRQSVDDEPPRGPRMPPWTRRMWMREMSTSGTVERYVINPHGDVDGVFLNNGIEVKFPPHIGDEILRAAAQRQPSWVQVSGDGTQNEYGTVVDAVTGTLAVNGAAIALDGPPGPGPERGPRP